MELKPGELTFSQLTEFYYGDDPIRLDESCWSDVEASRDVVLKLIERGETVYGLNTGFGLMATKKISQEDLSQLQINLVRSHSAGTGPLISDRVVRLMMMLKATSLARGYSGVRSDVVRILIDCVNAGLFPCIPEQGSVGASGDLAPLAHMSLALIGEGQFRRGGEIVEASSGLAAAGIEPLKLEPKEGLALINGTQVSTAFAISALLDAQRTFRAAVAAGALSIDAAKGSDTPFDPRIHAIRNHETQIRCAEVYRELLVGSEIRESHRDCSRVQDPYSLRCQPQVMGACLTSLKHAQAVLSREANAVSDNPLVFGDDDSMLSGGNFHAEPVAIVADQIAIALAEIGAFSERRIALLIDKHLSELPSFLIQDGGLNSGLMMPQVTAAAIASENKHLATPCSTDSIPTSANQEDHVSMATYAARRLHKMVTNVNSIVAIELLSAAQGIDFREELKTSPPLQKLQKLIRDRADFYAVDRTFHREIEGLESLIAGDELDAVLECGRLFS